MKCTLVGSRYFGATVLQALRTLPGVSFARVVAPAADDRLALAAKAAGLDLFVHDNPRLVQGEAIAPDTDLIIAAHTHARISEEALARSRLGGVGYHPSLLPRHRGIAAVEWTVLAGDPIAGGSVYHLADGWDAGALAAQDWCFVAKGETARELWERALAPMGLALLQRVVSEARDTGRLPAQAQDIRFATRAPMIRRSVVLTEGQAEASTSLVLTVIGPDRPAIVSQLADCAQRHGANWTHSHLSRMAGEFAGLVHLTVASDQVQALSAALQDLSVAGLQVTVAASGSTQAAPGFRNVELVLAGDDRLGIVSRVTSRLAERGVSIDQMHTDVVPGQGAGTPIFKVHAQLRVPSSVSLESLRSELDGLARELMLDLNLGDAPA